MLYKSNLVLYDRQTESLWMQITGEAVAGGLTGAKLSLVPAAIVSFKEWRDAFPEGKVLSRKTGHQRSYGRNPYVGYDEVGQAPFLYSDPLDSRLRPMERVVAVEQGGMSKAYPLPLLRKERVIEDTVGGRRLVIFYSAGTTSALDADRIRDSRDVGATGVYKPAVDGRKLTFEADARGFKDLETGSIWNILGQAVSGPLAGKRLTPVVHSNLFWFAQAAFSPETVVYRNQ